MTQNAESEQSIIGSVLSGHIAPSDAGLEPEHFYSPLHSEVWRIALDLDSDNKTADLITVMDRFPEDFPGDDPSEFLVSLAENAPHMTQGMLDSYSGIVKSHWQARELAEGLRGASLDLTAHNVSETLSGIDALADRLEGGSNDLAKDNKAALKEALAEIDHRARNPRDITGVTTGLKDLDSKTLGLQPSDLVILAARPSMGKTAMAINMLEAASESMPVAMFSLEMPARKIYQRMLAARGLVDYKAVRTGNLEPDDWQKMTFAVSSLHDRKIRIDDRSGLNPSQIRSACRRYKREMGGLGLIVVDYLQLMTVSHRTENETLKIGEISGQLKRIAKEFDCPVVALSQLNRGVENRPNKRPVNSDLRQSGAIEQDADLILFLYRDEVYNPDTTEAGIAEIIVGKAREGEIGMVAASWQGQYQKFSDLYHGSGYE